jgi:sigma-54 dependent transcriptional regulator of gfr operon
MLVSTKDELLNEVMESTKNFSFKNLRDFSANMISQKLNISRNLASQYLNELVKEGKLIKINSRPVYFIYKKFIEANFEISISKNVFLSVDQFADQLKTDKPELKNFKKAVGYNSSLAYCIEQSKAAMKYPPNGLPILLNGQSGTGKSFLAQLIYEYAVDENIIEKGSPFVSINCSEYADNPNLQMSHLFGCKNGQKYYDGYIRNAAGGILFLDEAHNLSPQCQENLFLLLDKGIYHEIGENGKWHHAEIRLILATTKDPGEAFQRAMLRRIPTIIKLPALNERSAEEKEEMILEFFKREARRISRKIFISNKVYKTLMDTTFPGNIGQLKSCICQGCADAFLHSSQNQFDINVYLYNLPEYIIPSAKLSNSLDNAEGSAMINIYSPSPNNSIDKILAFYDSVLNAYEDYKDQKSSLTELVNQEFANLNHYHDYLVYEKQYSDKKIQAIVGIIRDIFDYISNRYNIQLPSNCGFIISRRIYTQIQTNPEIRLWEEKRKSILQEIITFSEKLYPKEFSVMTEIKNLIKQNLDVCLSRIEMVLCMLSVKYYNIGKYINDVEGIIICHGYSTASSIASVANRLIGRHVYESIDMPINILTSEIVRKLRKHIQRVGISRSFILLVDMGSLENIGSELEDIPNLNMAIVNNVSTSLAIEVGYKICQGRDLKSIIKSAAENMKPVIKTIVNQKKEEAIIFTSETGTDTAEKMSELFLSSLPKAIPIKIIPCDYIRLAQNSQDDNILNKYIVLAIIGTSDPNVTGASFIYLEDIITLKKIKKINTYLSKYLNSDEIQKFNRNIIKNFSLQNVMQYLTILNADKLLDYVEEAVNKLQQLMQKKLSGETTLGIYVHICCLIERLVTKNPIETHMDLADFIQHHQAFISQVTKSFNVIEKHYGVKIPMSEIAYIYDYIANDKS